MVASLGDSAVHLRQVTRISGATGGSGTGGRPRRWPWAWAIPLPALENGFEAKAVVWLWAQVKCLAQFPKI